MAKHEVSLKVGHAIAIGNVDIELPVKVDGKPLGRMAISQGGVDWIPSPNKKNGYRLNWQQFAELLADHGKPMK